MKEVGNSRKMSPIEVPPRRRKRANMGAKRRPQEKKKKPTQREAPGEANFAVAHQVVKEDVK